VSLSEKLKRNDLGSSLGSRGRGGNSSNSFRKSSKGQRTGGRRKNALTVAWTSLKKEGDQGRSRGVKGYQDLHLEERVGKSEFAFTVREQKTRGATRKKHTSLVQILLNKRERRPVTGYNRRKNRCDLRS